MICGCRDSFIRCDICERPIYLQSKAGGVLLDDRDIGNDFGDMCLVCGPLISEAIERAWNEVKVKRMGGPAATAVACKATT